MEYKRSERTKRNKSFDNRQPGRNRNSNRKKTGSVVTPGNFIKKVSGKEISIYSPSRHIEELPVHKSIIANLLKKGYKLPTEIQDKTIDPILSGKNLKGLAQTGTGKTGAFLIPLIHSLINKEPSFQVLVISPTRELALQIDEEFRSIAAGLKLYSACLIGGTSVYNDIRNLRRPAHIVIGTPGRLADMVRQGALDLRKFTTLVLDEFDRLLDMGFATEIQRLVDGMVNRRQTILFSATENRSQDQLIRSLVHDPFEVRVRSENRAADNVEQDIIEVREGEKKIDILVGMVMEESFEKVLVFAETKRGVTRICRDLRKAGISADEIHGDKSQNYRIKALNSFRKRQIRVLVATDVAARGLDISNVSHVINFQPPKDMESYIHRIGRTGRAGATGKALTFIN